MTNENMNYVFVREMHYNNERPYQSIGNLTPLQKAKKSISMA